MIARKKAGKVQEKKPRKNMFPSDEESIELRRKNADPQARYESTLEKTPPVTFAMMASAYSSSLITFYLKWV